MARKSEQAQLIIFLAKDVAEYDALNTVDIIASGYEFDCEECGTYNTLIAIPKYGTAVECHKCKSRMRVGEVNEAND